MQPPPIVTGCCSPARPLSVSRCLIPAAAKGGGSANKTSLYQQTKALLNETSLKAFLLDKVKSLGTAACPPYHLAIAIGGLSAELNLKVVKLASARWDPVRGGDQWKMHKGPRLFIRSLGPLRVVGVVVGPRVLGSLVFLFYLPPLWGTSHGLQSPQPHRYLDNLPTSGNAHGRAFRDLEWEAKILDMTQQLGIGAQFGGKYFCHDVRVIRLPRHGASCPVGVGVSCSAGKGAFDGRAGMGRGCAGMGFDKHRAHMTYSNL